MIRHATIFTRSPIGIALVACGLALLASPRVRADVPTTFSAANCRAAGHDQIANFDYDTTAKTIHNKTTSSYSVYCPITKMTSGPKAGTNDAIKSVTIPVVSENGGFIDCNLETRSIPAVRGVQNVVGPGIGGGATSGTITITTSASNRPVGYWTANGANIGQPSWYYSYLSCTLPGGTTMGAYKVTELGSSTGYTIDPILSCPLTSNMLWVNVNDGSNPQDPGPSGYIRAQASGGLQGFSFACPVAGNTMTQVVESGGGVNPAGCNLNTSSVSSYAWPISHNGSDFPSEILAGAWQPVIAAPIVVGTANTLYCSQNSAEGDTRWFSFRTFPNLTHVGTWTASASANNADASKAIDNVGSSRWTSNTAGKAGMTFDVDLGANGGEFTNITLDSGSDADDYARLFSLQLSDDGQSWFTLGQFSATNRFTSFTFSEQSYRHIRLHLDKDIKNSAGATKYWSIHELNVYFNDGE